MITFFATFIAAAQVALLGLTLRSPQQRRRLWARYRWLRLGSAGHAFVAVTLVVFVALVLAAWFPVLDFSWWSLLGGQGNARLASVDPASAPDLPSWLPWLPALTIPSLLVLAPALAHAEERFFRRGAERRSALANAGRAGAFGAVHMLVGVPVWGAAALAVMGLYLNLQYRRRYERTGSAVAATQHVTAIHLTYNLFFLALLAAAISLALVGLTTPRP
jgi:hypothetical protein